MLQTSLIAAVKDQNPFSLKLDQETFITDRSGAIIPSSILKLTPGNAVSITLPDGKELKGLVKTTEFLNNEIFKIFGEINGPDNIGFGFVVTKTGILAGAVVFRDKNINFVVQFNAVENKYFLVKRIETKAS